MTIKSSVSIRDDLFIFAKALVADGQYPSVSAVIQQGLDLLRQQDADARAERAALQALLTERREGPFLAAADLRARLSTRRTQTRE